MTDERSLAVAAALTSVVTWASAFIGIRVAGRQLSPGPLTLGRTAVGSIVLGAFVLARSEKLPERRVLGMVAICGVLWFGVYNVALNAAERRIDAGTAALLVNTAPIFIAVLAGLLLAEGFPQRLFGGCVIAFTGVALIAIGVSHHGLRATWGGALCVLAALAYAAALIAQKPALRAGSALSITWLACLIGTLSCLPFAPGLVHELRHVRASGILWTVYLGAVPTAIGFLTWAYALARTSAGRLGSTTYLVPPLVVLLGWITLGEVPPLLAAPGGLLCLAGVAVARSAPHGEPEISEDVVSL